MKSNHNHTIWFYAKRYRVFIALLAGVFLANIAVEIVAPEVQSRFLDSLGSGLRQTLWMLLFYVAALALQAVALLALTYGAQWVGCHITDDYRRDVMAHYLNIGMRHHVRWTSGEMMTRLDEDVQGLFTYYYILIFKMIGNALLLVCVLTMLALRSGVLSAALLLLSVITILVFKTIQDRGLPKYTREQRATAEFNGTMKEMVDNAVAVRGVNAAGYMAGRLKAAMQRRFRESLPAGLMYGNLWTASTLMQGITYAAALFIGIGLWDAGTITMGTVYLIVVYTGLIYGPLQRFREDLGRMQSARGSMVRMAEFMAVPEDDGRGSYTIGSGAEPLDVWDVHFAYDDGTEVLRGVSLRLEPGEHLGVMGETGCGKSTLVSLIARMYPLERGEIYLGGVRIGEIAPDAFRSHVAYCTQNVQMIHGTLRDNITLYDRRYDDAQIRAAIDSLALTDWYGKFPDGLDTVLSMGEEHVSAGEAQLISIVRLALRDPGLVLLDEITARLDSATQQRIMNAMQRLCAGRSAIAIAHDDSALCWTDRILRMADGRFTKSQEDTQ